MEDEQTVANVQHAPKPYKLDFVWKNVLWLSYLHILAIYSLWIIPTAYVYTWIFAYAGYVVGGLGITAGAHRLWAHRSYKAKTPLRILLCIMQTMAVENDIIEWVRDHRVHHKYTETDADPHNATRGFFFAHCGWIVVKKHPEVKNKGKHLDMSDVTNDPVCALQRRCYVPASFLFGLVLPTVIPWYVWNESILNSFLISGILRYVVTLHGTWLVNSAAHLWGTRPYDKHINPADNPWVAMGAVGEGFHNYHHTFPQDYATSELGWKLNFTTMFIDFFAMLGQVTDRKKMPKELVYRRKIKSGDIKLMHD